MLQILLYENLSIWDQLRIEEALLRSDAGNWCLINTNCSDAIVMGISGKPEKLLNYSLLQHKPVPIIKRFSGGGTVYVDANTIFVTFICNEVDFSVPTQPKSIMEWSASIYQSFIPHLELRENDYVIGEKKCGGNAQYLQKHRWLHHTSFLWDFSPEKMNYLLLPEKRPEYRKDRAHKDFLCKLCQYFLKKEDLTTELIKALKSKFKAEIRSIAVEELLNKPHRKATTFVNVL